MMVVSTHYLRRRAERVARRIRRKQTSARADGGIAPLIIVDGWSVPADAPVGIRKRGKWAARYDVIVGRW